MYSSIYYLVVSGSEAAIRLPVRKSVSADLTTSRASQVVKDGCRQSYFTPRLDVACSKLNIEAVPCGLTEYKIQYGMNSFFC